MAFTESFAPFFADFGVDATLNGAAVRGIFDNPYDGTFGGMVSASGPVFQCAVSADVGHSLVIGASTFTVASVEPDGSGMFVLRLK